MVTGTQDVGLEAKPKQPHKKLMVLPAKTPIIEGMTQPPSSPVTSRRVGPVLHITLNDGKANALSFAIIDAVDACLTEAESDDEIRSVVISGTPGRFCAGFDLGVITGGSIADRTALVAGGGHLVHRLYSTSVPVVAACTGHAVAAGALLLLGCDYRIGPAEPGTAKIGLNEVAIGLSLPKWAITIAQERLSRRHLQRSVANSHIYDGPGATSAGFLDEVSDSDLIVEHAIAHATKLADTLNPAAYVSTLRSLRGVVAKNMADQIAADQASHG